MKVLVTAASRYGGTAGIARAIAAELEDRGFTTAVLLPDEVRSIDGYDAVILGSGVYAGHWMKPAKALVERSGKAMRGLPVWLFSSGPVGDPPKPEEAPVDVAEILDTTGARDHRIFGGKIVKRELHFPERAVVLALRVPEGDYRDWDEVRAWAGEIAEVLGSDR